MREVVYNEYAKQAIDEIYKGAFLNVTHDGKDNTMSIGWASIGMMWARPVLMVMVRYSRHTYRMLDSSGEFTVSIPFDDKFKEELAFCGTKSGRDYDKFAQCNMTKLKAHKVDAPLVGGCNMHYECKVIYKSAMEPMAIDPSIDKRFYNNNDFHVMFYGEIVGTYME